MRCAPRPPLDAPEEVTARAPFHYARKGRRGRSVAECSGVERSVVGVEWSEAAPPAQSAERSGAVCAGGAAVAALPAWRGVERVRRYNEQSELCRRSRGTERQAGKGRAGWSGGRRGAEGSRRPPRAICGAERSNLRGAGGGGGGAPRLAWSGARAAAQRAKRV